MKQLSLAIWTIVISTYFAYEMIGEFGYADTIQFPGLFEYLLLPVVIVGIGGMVIIDWLNHWTIPGSIWATYVAIIAIESGAIAWFLLLVHKVLLPWPIIFVVVLGSVVFVLLREQSKK